MSRFTDQLKITIIKEKEIFIDDRSVINSSASSTCTSCVRLQDPVTRRCQAFERIPDVIWNGKIKHRVPYRGDGGITYKRITEEELNTLIKEAEALL